jgi:hypothetical protein
MRQRLWDAAASDNVVEIQRLCALDMARRQDYTWALPNAMRHESIGAAAQLWACIAQCDQADADMHDDEDEHKSEYEPVDANDALLVRMALEASRPDFVRQVAQLKPDTLLQVLQSSNRWDAQAAPNLLELARMDQTLHLCDKGYHQDILLSKALFAALNLKPPSLYPHVAELVQVQGALAKDSHATHACGLIDLGSNDGMALVLLDLLLPSKHVDLVRLLEVCCNQQSKGRALRLLLENNDVQDEEGYCAGIASQHTAWESLEVCLELLAWEEPRAAFANKLLSSLEAETVRRKNRAWYLQGATTARLDLCHVSVPARAPLSHARLSALLNGRVVAATPACVLATTQSARARQS